MLIWFLLILVLSFVLALRSMSDFQVPKELKRFIDSKKIRGTIIFFKGKVKHYK